MSLLQSSAIGELSRVKIGEIPCYRASEMGRPRFLPEHVEACKEMIKKGKL